MNKLFGNTEMSWLRVLLFAAATGIYTGAIMLIPALNDTSFQDIGIFVEWWVIFAVIIVVNCRKSYEAMLKCFVFFLISQPLVYAVEVVFGSLPVEQAWLYYRSIWLPRTFLTLPGGFIAYYCRKENIIGAAVLGIGCMIQAFCGCHYLKVAIQHFPYHLISAVVCFSSVFVLILCIQKEKKQRIIAFIITAVLTIALLLAAMQLGLTI